MSKHMGLRVDNFFNVFFFALKIRGKYFDFYMRVGRSKVANAGGKMPRAAVGHIVTIHAGNHGIVHAHFANCLGKVFWFVGIKCLGSAMFYITKFAGAGAGVSHEHKGGSASTPALSDIGAVGRLAYRCKIE